MNTRGSEITSRSHHVLFLVLQPAADPSYSHPVNVQEPTLESSSEIACDKMFALTDRTFESCVCNVSESVLLHV